MIFNFVDLHKIFFILGTLEGDLIKKVFELILLVLITYMVVSEYTRDPRRDLKYLVAAFGALAFEKIVSTVVLTSVLFGGLGETTYNYYFPVIGHVLEIFALILLVNAFLFPIIIKKYKTGKKILIKQAILPGLLYLVFQVGLIFEVVYFMNHNAEFTNYLSGLIFTMVKIVLLLYAIYTLSVRTDIRYKYRYSIIISFLVYFVAPFLRLINIVFYNGTGSRLVVASHPFPILAVILFTRVIYLKLVDKAFLKKKLKISEEKYEHEKEISNLKDKFVSIVSHELRTPLTSIKLYTDLLKDGKFGKTTPKQNQAILTIKEETDRLANLINDILDLSKLEAKKMNIKIGIFDLSSFCKDNPYLLLAKNKGIQVISKCPENFVIKVDPDKFKQVLINLISNALKYTEKGSITLSAKEEADKYLIEISDTGRGIPPEEIDKIFDKFYQVEHYLNRDGGYGLGLSIVYEIIKLHKGEIKVSSGVGKGTKFSIFIPKSS